ncbi:MAG: hypothetical protein II956_07010 [Bacteroidales bacterium]|nr:hypothetical protein [Bacteroidales bacterium]
MRGIFLGAIVTEYLFSAILLTVSAVNAQVNKGSIWYENYQRLTCTGVSGNTLNFDLAMWGE